MQYHDYHLRGYSVTNFGADIELDLLWQYDGHPERTSQVRFSGVRLHHFEFTAPAILTEIEEVDVFELLARWAPRITELAFQQGVQDFTDDVGTLASKWVASGLRAWELDSAIGFSGFVVGRSVD